MGPPSGRDGRAMNTRHRPRILSPSVFLHWLVTTTRVSFMSALLSLNLVLTYRVTESASACTGSSPSPPPIATHEITRPDPGANTQGAPNRKRTRPPVQPTPLSDDSATHNRPRRATKETWKVREARGAREKFEAEASQTLLNHTGRNRLAILAVIPVGVKRLASWQISRMSI